MKDTIYRDDAIALVIKAIHGTDNKEIQNYLFSGLRRQMWSLPSADAATFDDAMEIRNTILFKEYVRGRRDAEAVQGWIPCSERLPEKDELVLATVWNDVSIAWRNIYGGWESAEDMYGKEDVTAWMPLPEPYKGGDDE